MASCLLILMVEAVASYVLVSFKFLDKAENDERIM